MRVRAGHGQGAGQHRERGCSLEIRQTDRTARADDRPVGGDAHPRVGRDETREPRCQRCAAADVAHRQVHGSRPPARPAEDVGVHHERGAAAPREEAMARAAVGHDRRLVERAAEAGELAGARRHRPPLARRLRRVRQLASQRLDALRRRTAQRGERLVAQRRRGRPPSAGARGFDGERRRLAGPVGEVHRGEQQTRREVRGEGERSLPQPSVAEPPGQHGARVEQGRSRLRVRGEARQQRREPRPARAQVLRRIRERRRKRRGPREQERTDPRERLREQRPHAGRRRHRAPGAVQQDEVEHAGEQVPRLALGTRERRQDRRDLPQRRRRVELRAAALRALESAVQLAAARGEPVRGGAADHPRHESQRR